MYWYSVRLYRYFLTRFVSDDTESSASEDLAAGCLGNEIGVALILCLLLPFVIALIAAAVLDVLTLPYKLWLRFSFKLR